MINFKLLNLNLNSFVSKKQIVVLSIHLLSHFSYFENSLVNYFSSKLNVANTK